MRYLDLGTFSGTFTHTEAVKSKIDGFRSLRGE